MAKEELIDHIYQQLCRSIPELTQDTIRTKAFISKFIDAFLKMYPAHHTELMPNQSGYEFHEITIFCVAELEKLRSSPTFSQWDAATILPLVSRFLFSRHASLVSLRVQTTMYPIHHLDTTHFKPADHENLLRKLTLCYVTTLSLVFPKVLENRVMTFYVKAFYAEQDHMKLVESLKKIEFFGLSCVKSNLFLIEQLLKNKMMLAKCLLTIQMPEWDQNPSSEGLDSYYELQNHIRDNQKTVLIAASKGARPALRTWSECQTRPMPRLPEFFVGDHRQFALMAPTNQNAWRYFDKFMAMRRSHVEPVDLDKYSTFLELLHTWAVEHEMDADCAAELFANPSTFTPANAQALGQLFNTLDSQKSGPIGTQRWIQIVNLIWKHFGRDHFFAWKAYELDPYENWVDCVENDEAMTVPYDTYPFLTPLAYFQSLWLAFLKSVMSHPTRPVDNNFLRYLQTLLPLAESILLFGENNVDFNELCSHAHESSHEWLEFFTTLNYPSVASFVPCRLWTTILNDRLHQQQILAWLPTCFSMLQSTQKTEIITFGVQALQAAVRDNVSDKDMAEALRAIQAAANTYQAFQKHSHPSYQTMFDPNDVPWTTIYFATIQREEYRHISATLLICTQQARNTEELVWILDLAKLIALSEKADDHLFLACMSQWLTIQNFPSIQTWINILFPTSTAVGFTLTLPILRSLWELWRTQKITEPQQVLAIGCTAQTILNCQSSADFNRYIDDHSQRLSLMKMLSQGYLHGLGIDLIQRCYRWYRAALQQIFQWVNWSTTELGKRHGLYQQAYQILKNLNHELQQITGKPNSSPRSAHSQPSLALRVQYERLFAEQERCYAGFFWSSNRSRINQARQLFHDLRTVAANNKPQYYTQLLHTILRHQNSIFTGDKSYYFYPANQKGYSRLHDLSTELFLIIARDCLWDRDLTETDKAYISSLLKQQVREHAQLLAEQIQNPQLAQKINRWLKNDGGCDALQTILKTHPPDKTNSKLQYLYRSLQIMVMKPDTEIRSTHQASCT